MKRPSKVWGVFVILSLLLVCNACNKGKKEALLEDLPKPTQKDMENGKIPGKEEEITGYVKKQVPLPEETGVVVSHLGELNMVFIDDLQLKEAGILTLKLYRLINEEWVSSNVEWSIDTKGGYILGLCYDSNGTLYGYEKKYIDTKEEEKIEPGASVIWMLYEDGSMESKKLDNKELMNEFINSYTGYDEENMDIRQRTQMLDFKVLDDGRVFCVLETIQGFLLKSYNLDSGEELSSCQYEGFSSGFLINQDEVVTGSYLYQFKSPSLRVSDVKNGNFLRSYTYGNSDEYEDDMNVVLWKGEEDDIFVCSKFGIYGGKLDDTKLETVVDASILGLENQQVYINGFYKGLEDDFYVYCSGGSGLELYHIIYNDVGVKRYFDPMIPTDCYALCASAILKHSKSALFGLLSHVFRVPKSCFFMQA